MRKKDFDRFVRLGLSKKGDAKKIIQSLINWLIISLYIPDKELIKVVDTELIQKLGLDKEPINWGDLKCFEVEKLGESWVAYVDEADPSAYNLQQYLEKWMRVWGWNVKVVTEW